MGDKQNYDEAVKAIKTAILQSQIAEKSFENLELAIPKQKTLQLSQFGTCKFQTSKIFQLMRFCI